jgi:membrane protease YdiL (CAAX protease family)
VVGVTGGAIEETLYRGYAIERLATITGRRWLGGAISAVAFGLAHVPGWGIGFALAADLPFGIVMTLFYLWRRDLVANILAHSTVLVVSLLTAVP